jgi:ParB family chromosome partitioning protein
MERKTDPLKKRVLGRGLSALLPEPVEKDYEVVRIPAGQIRANPYQPRRTFSPEQLQELVESIREKGILQPLLVRKTLQGYELVAGERRLRAAQAAGIETVPAVVRKFSDRESLEAAVVENVQRADLNPIELAEGLNRLVLEFDLTQEEAARRIGKDRATVANTLRLLKLPAEAQAAVAEGRISAGHARALLSAPAPRILDLLSTILKQGLSVREAEELCQGAGEGRRKPSPRVSRKDPHLLDLEERLSRRGGTRVRVRGTARKGRFEIAYFSEAEFHRLCEVLFPGR